jgi:hypothetical protein
MNIGFFSKTLNAYEAHVAQSINNYSGEDANFYLFNLKKIYSPDYDENNIACPTIDLSQKVNIVKTLKKYNLDYLVFINPGHIYSLFLINICNQLSIKSIFFQHGLSLDLSSFDIKTLARDKSFKRKYSVLKKYVFFYSSISINIIFIKNRLSFIRYLLVKSKFLGTLVFNSKDFYKFPKYGVKGLHCQYAFVYGNSDKEYLIQSMDMNPEKIILSGYPFLFPTMDKPAQNKKKILYLTSAFRATGVIPISIKEEREFYQLMYKKVKASGMKLIIKAHPKDDYKLIQGFFAGIEDVEIYNNKNLADLTISSDVVISDFSTALFYAIKYLKPIIILTSEYFETYPFDYTKYGIGVKTKLDTLDVTIKDSIKLTSEQVTAYDKFTKRFLFDSKHQNTYQVFFQKLEEINIIRYHDI